MPLVRISLLKGKPVNHVRAIADSVHSALVEAFGVPQKDRFQLIHQHDPEELLYDAEYLDVRRTDDIVVINVVVSSTRSTAAKQLLYKTIAANLAKSPGLRPQDVLIVLSPNQREDWSFGNGIASYVPEEK